MANDYIIITKTNRPQLGTQTVRFANLLRELRDLNDALLDAANHMHDGATYTTVEAQFGLPGGTGANFVSLLALGNDILNTNATVAGATRLAQLDEIVARLAGQ